MKKNYPISYRRRFIREWKRIIRRILWQRGFQKNGYTSMVMHFAERRCLLDVHLKTEADSKNSRSGKIFYFALENRAGRIGDEQMKFSWRLI